MGLMEANTIVRIKLNLSTHVTQKQFFPAIRALQGNAKRECHLAALLAADGVNPLSLLACISGMSFIKVSASTVNLCVKEEQFTIRQHSSRTHDMTSRWPSSKTLFPHRVAFQ